MRNHNRDAKMFLYVAIMLLFLAIASAVFGAIIDFDFAEIGLATVFNVIAYIMTIGTALLMILIGGYIIIFKFVKKLTFEVIPFLACEILFLIDLVAWFLIIFMVNLNFSSF